jgi:HEAT repeats
LDVERREIEEGLIKRSKHRDRFRLDKQDAVRPRDIQRALLDINPQIVHFAGYGKGEEGLIFEDELGHPKFVDGAALAGLFSLFSDQLKCVVLNAYYSQAMVEEEAQALRVVKLAMDEVDLMLGARLAGEVQPSVRRSAAEALGQLSTVEAIPGLLKAIEHQDSFVRGSAAEALGKIGNSKPLAELWKRQFISSETYLYSAISAIQNRCQYYNHEIAHNLPLQGKTIASTNPSPPETIEP